jgi:hypothetical protein
MPSIGEISRPLKPRWEPGNHYQEAVMVRNRRSVVSSLLVAPLLCSTLLAGAAEAAPSSPAAGTPYAPEIDPADFTTRIDNRYWPLQPGTTFVYDGTSDGEKEHNEVAVTSQTKTSLGVRCVVVRDTVTVDGELTEDTLDWYAQDKTGNVWYFGEESKSYENGKVASTEGSWEAGIDGAQPGILMPADPKVGDEYRQEYYAGEAEDMAAVLKLGGSVTVPYGTFDDVLVTKEWSPLEPDVVEHKTYAPGVGLILSESVQGEQERLELIDIQTGGATPEATPRA